MKKYGISSVFVVDDQNFVEGIVTIDDAIKGIREKKNLKDLVRNNISIVKQDDYVNELIPKALESKFPLVVLDENKKLVGIILRVHVLAGLVSDQEDNSN